MPTSYTSQAMSGSSPQHARQTEGGALTYPSTPAQQISPIVPSEPFRPSHSVHQATSVASSPPAGQASTSTAISMSASLQTSTSTPSPTPAQSRPSTAPEPDEESHARRKRHGEAYAVFAAAARQRAHRCRHGAVLDEIRAGRLALYEARLAQLERERAELEMRVADVDFARLEAVREDAERAAVTESADEDERMEESWRRFFALESDDVPMS